MLHHSLAALLLVAFGATPAVAVDPVEDSALRQAWQAFLSQRTACGDRLVMAVDVSPPPMSGFVQVPAYKPLTPYTVYVEAATIEILRSGPGRQLAEVERRNGLAWKGTFQFVAKAARQIAVGKSGHAARWSDWYGDVLLFTLDMEHRNGVWDVQGQQAPGVQALGRLATPRRPACSEVPA